MPSIKDESTVEAIARAFTSNGRKKQEALSSVGYADSYAWGGGRGCEVVFSNVRVKAAIARIDTEIGDKREHDREASVGLLRQNLSFLSERANKGDIQAVQARTATIRELNAISNLHSSTVFDGGDKPSELTSEELEVLRADAKRLTALKLRTG